MDKKSVDTITFEVDKLYYIFKEDKISEELYSMNYNEFGTIELVFNPFRDEFTIRQYYDNNGYDPEIIYDEFTLDDPEFDDLFEEDKLAISKFICKVYAQNPIRVYKPMNEEDFDETNYIEELEESPSDGAWIEAERDVQDIKEEIEKGGDYE